MTTSVRRWPHLSGHPPEPVEPRVRCVRRPFIHPGGAFSFPADALVAADRSQPPVSCELRGGAAIHREPHRVQSPREAGDRRERLAVGEGNDTFACLLNKDGRWRVARWCAPSAACHRRAKAKKSVRKRTRERWTAHPPCRRHTCP